VSTPPTPWEHAIQAIVAFSLDPNTLGGIWLRARSSPVRDRFLAALTAATPTRKLSAIADDEQLYGGLDITATLAAQSTIMTEGLLIKGGTFITPMAERIPAELAGRLGIALDAGTLALVALDEGADDERVPAALQDRLAIHLDFDALSIRECPEITLPDQRATNAKANLPPETIQHLTVLAARMGIHSIRAPLHALRTARALTAVSNNTQEAIQWAIRLCLVPRMLTLPPAEDDLQDEAKADPPTDSVDGDPNSNQQSQTEEDLMLKAAKALLPKDLLTSLAAMDLRGATPSGGSKSGAKRSGNRRGRRLPSRKARASSAARIDLLATLRAAAPWQPLRRKARPRDPRAILIEPGDIHTRRTQDVSDRAIVFAVDASGSSALARLAEAKGAIEILLAEAYSRRDHVALIAFRGEGADGLLPPTRSIVQTKRRLAALPGGGGTPLAAGLRAAHETLDHAIRKGMAPTLVILTDGVANIALDGQPGRSKAGEDALAMAKALRIQSAPIILIDTARRQQPLAQDLSKALTARYVPMPRADARRMAGAVSEVLR